MKKNFVKKLALGLALVMAVTSVPATSKAAATPGFKSTKVTVKEGQTKKYSTENASKYSVKFKIGNKSVATIKYSAGSKSVKVTGVAEGTTTLRADFKSYKTKKVTTARIPVAVVVEKTEVKAATATASRVITLTGTNLDKLTQADVTVAGYTLTGFATTKTSATITLDRMMVPNVDIAVTAGEFKGTVKYNLTVNSLAVVAGTFDDDLAKQTVKFTVNGEQIDAQDLIDNGYTVDFSAYNVVYGVETPANYLFANRTLGVIAVPATEDTYYVSVTVSNGTTVVTSEYAKVVIDDLHASINSIDSYVLLNGGGFVQNSTTMVMGETATFAKVYATVDGIKKQEIVPTSITSSNPSVVSVSYDGTNTLTAETAGTSVITLTYGSAKKTVTITVATTGRVLSSAKAVSEADAMVPVVPTTTGSAISSATVVSKSAGTSARTLYIIPLDQYGDPIAQDVYAASSNNEIIKVTNPANWQTAATRFGDVVTINVDVQEDAKGYATIIVRNKPITAITNQTNTKTLLTFAYNVVNNDTVAYKKLVLAPQSIVESTDATLEKSVDPTTTLVLAGYNSSNIKVKELSLAGYTVTSTDTAVVKAEKNGDKITVTAQAAGTATVTLTDAAGKKVSIVFTVTSTVPTITGVTFKQGSTIVTQNAKVDFGTFLTLTEVGTSRDAIVSGISTNVNTTSKIRVTSAGELYLDRNDSGVYNDVVVGRPGDILLGYIDLSTTNNSNFVLGALPTLVQPGDAGFIKAVVTAANHTTVIASATVAVNVPNVQ